MAGLRVLLTNIVLSGRTGTEIVTRDLALGLLRRGHRPVVYAPQLGPIAAELRAASIPVTDAIDAIAEAPDVIHGHHNVPLAIAIARFPGVPAIFVCHDFTAWHDAPPSFPSIRRYVAVDETVAERLRFTAGIAANRTAVHLNAVDLERFTERREPAERPRRALAFVKHTAHVAAVRAACEARGIALDVAGTAVGQPLTAPERVLAKYDLVFTTALSALEAMASGCAVIACDARGLAGMVTPETFARWRPYNFGLRTLTRRVTADALAEEIDRYDAAAARDVTDLVRASAGLASAVDRYVDVYERCIAEDALDGRDEHDRAVARFVETWRPRTDAQWPWMLERARLRDALDAALERMPPLHVGEGVALDAAAPRAIEFVAGFGQPEPWGVWTEGDEAVMVLHVDGPGAQAELALLTHAFVRGEHPKLDVHVCVNGTDAGTWHFAHPDEPQWRTLRVPIDPRTHGTVVIAFSLRTPRSPRAIGAGEDDRRLGLGLHRIELRGG